MIDSDTGYDRAEAMDLVHDDLPDGVTFCTPWFFEDPTTEAADTAFVVAAEAADAAYWESFQGQECP
jgi:hypothetical protein